MERDLAANGIAGKNVLVLGGGGMVGTAVGRELMLHGPALVVIAARHEGKANQAVAALRADFPGMAGRIHAAWGDVFLRSEWQSDDGEARTGVLADGERRRRLIDDILEPLDADILGASLLSQMIQGSAAGLEGAPADIVVDCMNTATAVSYQDIYSLAGRMAGLARHGAAETDWPQEVETLLAALSVPQLVRHIQILYAAMREAGTRAYIKVGTSGTGGMGFNIPYTHGEEKPSRLLLSKAALSGAQTLLTFLMARTPDAPPIVREIKPTALIGWHRIAFGPIRRRGRDLPLYDCSEDEAVSVRQPENLAPAGAFGHGTEAKLEGVYIDTGENGVFAADEFAAITTLGQMQLITPEEVAQTVVAELIGRNTGHDVVAALDGSVSGPTYRAGYLRQSALTRLRQLESEHGQAVAFEILGPPRLSKLLFEAHLLMSGSDSPEAIASADPTALARRLARLVRDDADLRRRMLSIGIPVLLPDGERLLRGPVIKSADAQHGWVDLRPENMRLWQERLGTIKAIVEAELAGETSSLYPRIFTASRNWATGPGALEIGEIAGWIFIHEDGGQRLKD